MNDREQRSQLWHAGSAVHAMHVIADRFRVFNLVEQCLYVRAAITGSATHHDVTHCIGVVEIVVSIEQL